MEAKQNDAIQQLLEEMKKALEAGGNFVSEQAPPLCREIATYGVWSNTFDVVALSALVIACLFYWVRFAPRNFKYFREGKKRQYCDLPDGSVQKVICMVASGVVGLFSLISLVVNVKYLIMATTAPRLYVLTYLAGLLK